MLKRLLPHARHGGLAVAGNLANLLFSLGRVKLIAASLGPAGMGLVSLYANFFELAATLFAAGYAGALNRELPRRSGTQEEAGAWRAAAWFTFLPALLLSPLLVWGFYESAGALRFSAINAVILLLVMLCSTAWRLLTGYLLGRRLSGDLFRIMFFGSLLPLTGAGLLMLGGIREPLVYAAIAPILMLLSAFGSGGRALFAPRELLRRPTREDTMNLTRMAMPMMLTLVMIPAMWFYLRTTVEARLGLVVLGYMQPSFQLVVLFASLFNNFAGMTILRWDQSREAPFSRSQVRLLIVASTIPVLGGVICFLVRPLLELAVVILFSREFLPAAVALPWFLAGEALRMGAFLLNQTYISKGYNSWTITPRVACFLLIVALVEWGGVNSLFEVARIYALGYVAFFVVSLGLWVRIQWMPSR